MQQLYQHLHTQSQKLAMQPLALLAQLVRLELKP